MPTLQLIVGASADDASELATTVVSITATPLANCDTTGVWNGWIFRGINIPAGATIISASLGIIFTSSSLDEPDVTISGLDTATPSAFAASNADISGRTRTTASVPWSNSNAGTSRVQTSDISTIIQELVDSYGPYEDGVMGFVWTSTNGTATRDTSAQSYDGSTSNCAQLNLVYSPNLINVSQPVSAADQTPTLELPAGSLEVKDIPQAVGVTDSPTVEMIRLVNVAQTVGVAEALGNVYSEEVVVSEQATVTLPVAGLEIKDIPENVGVTDSASLELANFAVDVSQAVGAADQAPALVLSDLEINVSQAVGLTEDETVNATGDLTINLSQDITATDQTPVIEVSVAEINLSQAVGVADTATVATGGFSLIDVGDGYSDGTPKQIVRTSDGRIWVTSRAFITYAPGPASPLRVYKADNTTIPAAFTREDSAHEPADVAAWGMAVDGNDLLHIVWAHRASWDSGNGDGIIDVVRYATFNTSTNLWGAVTDLETSLATWEIGQGDEQVCVTLDENGYPHVVYLKGEVPRIIRYTFWDGEAWTTPVTLATYAGTSCWHPGLRFDQAGRLILTYMVHEWNGSSTARFYVRVLDGTWGSPVDVTGADLYGGIDATTALYLTADNRYHIAFLSATNKYIRYYYSDNLGASWTANNPGAGSEIGDDPQVGMGPGGTQVRIYAHNADATPGMSYFEGEGGGGTWSARQTIIDNDTPFDCTANPRYSRYFFTHPEYLDVLFWDSTYGGNGNELWLAVQLTTIQPQINVSQTVAITDTATVSLEAPADLEIGLAQAVGIAESAPVALTAAEINLSQLLGVSEAAPVLQISTSQVDVAQAVGVAEAVLAVLVAETIEVSQPVSATDSAQAVLTDLTLALTEPVGAADNLNLLEVLTEINVSQAAGVAETATELISSAEIVGTETITVEETVNVSAGGLPTLIPSVFEDVALGENLVLEISTAEINLVQAVMVVDSATPTISDPQIDLSQAVGVVDIATLSLGGLGTLDLAVSETIVLTENSPAAISAPQIAVSQMVSLTEIAAAEVSLTVTASQAIGLAEMVTVTSGALQIGLSQSVALTETATLFLPQLYLSVTEAIGVGETGVPYWAGDLFILVGQTVQVQDQGQASFFGIVPGTPEDDLLGWRNLGMQDFRAL